MIDRFVARAPWWALLLAVTALTTGTFALIAAFDDQPNHRMTAIAGPVLGIGLTISILLRRRKAQEVTGLDPVVTQQASRALDSGVLPDDPEVALAVSRLLPAARAQMLAVRRIAPFVVAGLLVFAVVVTLASGSWVPLPIAAVGAPLIWLRGVLPARAALRRFDRLEEGLRAPGSTDR